MPTQSTTNILEKIAVSEEDGRPIPDAATRDIIGYAPVHTVADLNVAIATARSAQPAWAALGHADRSRILNNIADEIEATYPFHPRLKNVIALFKENEQFKQTRGLKLLQVSADAAVSCPHIIRQLHLAWKACIISPCVLEQHCVGELRSY